MRSILFIINSILAIGFFCSVGSKGCAQPKPADCATTSVEVPKPPQKPKNVTGPEEVCPGCSQYYSATSDGPDYIIEWTWWTGGPDSATCTGDRVMISFGRWVSDISVRQVDRRTGCRSAAVRKEVRAYSFAPWPYAGSLIKVCAGQTFELDKLTPGDATVLYEWSVHPTNAASVIGDHTKPNVSVLANYSYYHTHEYVAMVLWRRACGYESHDTAWVYIGEIEPPEIDSLRTYNAHVKDQLRMTSTSDWTNADSVHSYWEVSDGDSAFRVDGLPGRVVFPAGGTYRVVLHYVAQQGCTASCTTHVAVNDSPAVLTDDVHVEKSGSDPTANTFSATTQCNNILEGHMPDFSVADDCSGNIVVTDNTQYPPPPYAIPLRVAEAIPSGSSSGTRVTFTADGTMARLPVLGTITEPTSFLVKVYIGSDPDCYIEYERTFDPMLRLVSVDFPNSMCEDTPKTFSAVAVGCDLEYRWDFNDGSYNYGNGIYHTYEEGSHSPSLKVTDCHGCSVYNVYGPIIVNVNPIMNRSIVGQAPDCYGNAMQVDYFMFGGHLPCGATYTWTPTSFTQPTIQIYAGGDYLVLEELPTLGCRRETSGNTHYPNEIIAQIRCQGSYCEGDEVTALGYAGDQYRYSWELYDNSTNTLLGTSPDANYTFTPPAAGNYRLELTVSNNICSKKCTTQFAVHPSGRRDNK